jgi:hypothetical protein|tara:strand:+ start:3169 stop:3861 length:693 start_codon:yes stop_codon:yes gene_type:complete
MTEQSATSGDVNVADTGTDINTTSEENQNQEERIFSQKDVDKIVQARLEKYKRRFSDIDMNEYKALKTAEEEREIEAMKKREEFDTILSQQKEKYSEEINTLRTQLTGLKVDGTLLDVASKRNAVSPEQVAMLLKDKVGLDETGRPVVFDANKSVIYDPETAEPKSLESLVNEFLDNNPHFIRSGPSGVASNGATGNVASKTAKQDLSSLDLTKPADREIYRQWKADGKI